MGEFISGGIGADYNDHFFNLTVGKKIRWIPGGDIVTPHNHTPASDEFRDTTGRTWYIYGGLSKRNWEFVNTIETKEQKMGFVKEYFNKHRELFMGLAVAIVLDRYLLGGAFQERLKRIITGMLDKTESALELEHPKKK